MLAVMVAMTSMRVRLTMTLSCRKMVKYLLLILCTYTKVCNFKKVSEEANQDENHLLQEHAKQVELNISGIIRW